MSEDTREYYVTVIDYECQQGLIDDLETIGGGDNIPHRAVEKREAFPNSRTTTFMLSQEEADFLMNDDRVLDIEPISKFDDAVFELDFEQEGNFRKNYWSTWNSNDYSWGLLRCTTRDTSADLNWHYGDPGYTAYGSATIIDDPTTGSSGQSTTVRTGLEGKNVDIVILDEAFTGGSPEFAVNSDGTGGTRFVEYNWFQHNPEVTGDAAGTYVYGYTATSDHGHCSASVAAGNTCGFARKANIYNLNVFTNTNSSVSIVPGTGTVNRFVNAFGYIKEFHNNKPINSETGRRNPTIVNMSIGIGSLYSISAFESIEFDGVSYSLPLNKQQLQNAGLGMRTDTVTSRVGLQSTTLGSAVEDMIDEGVIFVCSAGNEDMALYAPGSDRYDNTRLVQNFGGNLYYYYYLRVGSTHHANGKGIVVGALSMTRNDRKSRYSCKGPRVDVYAPAEGHKASTYTGASGGSVVVDSRNSTYSFKPFGGTSCASPVTAGVIACLLQEYPDWTYQDAKGWLSAYANKGHITAEISGYSGSGSPVSDWDETNYGIWDSPNNILYFHQNRPPTGNSFPRKTHSLRPSSGLAYPRRKIRVKG